VYSTAIIAGLVADATVARYGNIGPFRAAVAVTVVVLVFFDLGLILTNSHTSLSALYSHTQAVHTPCDVLYYMMPMLIGC